MSVGQTDDSDRPILSASTDAAPVSPVPPSFLCQVCLRSFTTKSGLGVHVRRAHPIERDQSVELPSVKPRWEPEILRLMARQEALATKRGIRFINQHLVELVPGRTLESIKGVRRRADYRELVSAALVDIQASSSSSSSSGASPSAPPGLVHESPISDPLHSLPDVFSPALQPSTSHASASPLPSTSSSALLVSPRRDLPSSASVSEFPNDPSSSLLGWQSLFDCSLPTAIRSLSSVVSNVRGWRSHELVDIARSVLAGADVSSSRQLLSNWFSSVFPVGASPPVSARRARRFPVPRSTRRQLRRQEYAAAQRLFRSNMSGCVRSVLDGVPLAASVPMPAVDEMVEYWTDVVTTPSKPLPSKRAFPVRPHFQAVWGPVMCEEVVAEFVALRSASGPDGVSPRLWRATPVSVIALFFNLVLFLGGFPVSMLVSRTVFVPKKGSDPPRPSDFRPISVSSVVVRHLHKILARRLHQFPLSDSRQRCFDDGCAENTSVLSALLQNARSSLKPLMMALLDIAKAFDSVSHEAVLYALRKLGLPPEFCEYIKFFYASSSTQFWLHGFVSPLVPVTRGVRQGDPLSSLLFSYVIDLILADLPRGVFVDFLGCRVAALAYADDVLLFGSTVMGLQASLDAFEAAARRFGLLLNSGKCGAFAMVPHGKRKTFKVLTDRQFHLSSGSIPQFDSLARWRYLGVDFQATGPVSVSFQLETFLRRISEAPFKPQQRLMAVRSFLLPRLYHGLVLGKCNSSSLRLLDLQVRSSVRKWLRLPHDVPVSFFYTAIRDGGLGIPCLGLAIPALLLARLSSLESSSLEAARVSFLSDWVQGRLAFARRALFYEGSILSSSAKQQIYWRRQLYRSTDGFELRECYKTPESSYWVARNCLGVPGRDYVQHVHTRINALPSAVRTSRGRRQGVSIRCRAGCNVTETTAHVIQSCFRTHGGRVLRHDAVAKMLAGSLRRKNYDVRREHLFCTQEGRRKPDLLAVKDGVATVIDVQVVSGARPLLQSHTEKKNYYARNEDLVRKVCHLFNVALVLFTTATVSWRGVWAERSLLDLRAMGLSAGVFAGVTTRVLQGSSTNFGRWNRTTMRHHHPPHHHLHHHGRQELPPRAGIG